MYLSKAWAQISCASCRRTRLRAGVALAQYPLVLMLSFSMLQDFENVLGGSQLDGPSSSRRNGGHAAAQAPSTETPQISGVEFLLTSAEVQIRVPASYGSGRVASDTSGHRQLPLGHLFSENPQHDWLLGRGQLLDSNMRPRNWVAAGRSSSLPLKSRMPHTLPQSAHRCLECSMWE